MTVRAKSVPTMTASTGERLEKIELDDEAMLVIKLLGKFMMSMTRGAKTPPT